ncbi:MAG: two-component system, NtrC family, response regulator HydG [Frankiales bacterium]|jgi:CheY-like chemotaxis protein|nr:two-component system, NtrC family, response regulator HydG [Frankiales bacterium]
MTDGRRCRVLVVDDEPGMRETLVDILEAVGYEVSAAPDGDVAVSHVREQPVDVVVMDMQMPNCDGVLALERLYPPPPTIIMMTAYAIEERMRAAVDANAFAILHKPFPVGRLLSVVASASAEVA